MLDVTHQADIAVLRMRHGKVNALDIELCEHITGRLEELGTSSVRAVVLTGQAGIFSAGVDLLRALEGDAGYLRDFLPVLRKLFDVAFFYPKPVVAAINGHAIAGGCVLACAADQRLMARGSGRIGVTELLVGLPFPAIALEIMRFTAVPAPTWCGSRSASRTRKTSSPTSSRGWRRRDDLVSRAQRSTPELGCSRVPARL